MTAYLDSPRRRSTFKAASIRRLIHSSNSRQESISARPGFGLDSSSRRHLSLPPFGCAVIADPFDGKESRPMHPLKKAAHIVGAIYLSMVGLTCIPSTLIVRGNSAATAE